MIAWIAVGLATLVIFFAGPRLARSAEHFANRLNIQHAIGGAVFLGMMTSLAGTVVSVSAAARGDAELALSNGLGGIAAQTVFLAFADFFHRRANLEHDSTSVANLFQIGLLLALLSAVMMAFVGPDFTFWHLHPVSLILPATWIIGTIIANKTGERGPWVARGRSRPEQEPPASEEISDASNDDPEWSGQGDNDEPEQPSDDKEQHQSVWTLGLKLLLFGALTAGAGYTLSKFAPQLTEQLGVTDSAIGFILTATATSLPELVTTITAVRRGALTLAVGNIVGGNAFDTLFCSISDLAYTDGSIYHAVGRAEPFITTLGMLLTALLLMGLIGRERHGIAGVGAESLLIIGVYALGVASVVMM